MDTTLIVRFAMPYGRILYVPVNENAKSMASLMRRKSFSVEDINALKQKGFTVKLEAKAEEIL